MFLLSPNAPHKVHLAQKAIFLFISGLVFMYIFFKKSCQIYPRVGHIHLNHNGCCEFVAEELSFSADINDVEGIPTAIETLLIITIFIRNMVHFLAKNPQLKFLPPCSFSST